MHPDMGHVSSGRVRNSRLWRSRTLGSGVEGPQRLPIEFPGVFQVGSISAEKEKGFLKLGDTAAKVEVLVYPFTSSVCELGQTYLRAGQNQRL